MNIGMQASRNLIISSGAFALFGAVLLALPARALSLFPLLSNAPVAMTTNREAARGLASDGTNFLVAFQGDWLYTNAASPSNQLAAQLLSPEGAPLGGRIDLSRNGSLPLTAFDGTNYLVVWAEAAGDPPGIWGQFLDRGGQILGGTFLIQSNAAVAEVGGLCFQAGRYLVVWAVPAAVSNEALIQGQWVRPSGAPEGPALELSVGGSGAQQYPAVSAASNGFLVTWVARRSDTNLWDVLGRFVDASGGTAPAFVISQTPAWAAYPVAAAFDGTNHLAVWSREAGPGHQCLLAFEPGVGYIWTNLFFPMLCGRLLNGYGPMNGNEFTVSRAQWGQTSPTVAFDGTNYLVAWNDRRYSGYIFELWLHSQTNYLSYLQFVSPSGVLVEKEFIGDNVLWCVPLSRSGGASIGPVLALGSGRALLLRCLSSQPYRAPDDVGAIVLLERPSTRPHISVVGASNGYLHVAISGLPEVSYALYASSNLVDWPSPTQVAGWGPSQNVFNPGYAGTFDVPMNGQARFLRGHDATDVCKSNLRRIMWAKAQYALDRARRATDIPLWSDLFGPQGYFPDVPVCPNAGTYTMNSIDMFPACSIWRHHPP